MSLLVVVLKTLQQLNWHALDNSTFDKSSRNKSYRNLGFTILQLSLHRGGCPIDQGTHIVNSTILKGQWTRTQKFIEKCIQTVSTWYPHGLHMISTGYPHGIRMISTGYPPGIRAHINCSDGKKAPHSATYGLIRAVRRRIIAINGFA